MMHPLASTELQSMVLTALYELKEGERIRLDGRVVRDAFPTHWMLPHLPPPIEQLSEKLVGINYGAWIVTEDEFNRTVTVQRRKPGDKRVREDWDRR